MLRAILTLCLLLALGAPAAADGLTVGDPPRACLTKQQVIDLILGWHPGTTYEPIDGARGLAIKAAIKGAKATEYIVFKKPNSGDRRIIVGFRDGCKEDQAPVTQGTIDYWMRGQEAGQ